MPFPVTDKEKATKHNLLNPRVGDRYSEMFAFWVYVVAVTEDFVAVVEAHPPCTLPDDGKLRYFENSRVMEQAYAYGGTTTGHFIRYQDNNDVSGWYEALLLREGKEI